MIQNSVMKLSLRITKFEDGYNRIFYVLLSYLLIKYYKICFCNSYETHFIILTIIKSFRLIKVTILFMLFSHTISTIVLTNIILLSPSNDDLNLTICRN